MKKIKLLATFVLMIMTMTTFTIISRATTGIVNDDAIKIRREPNDKSTIIDLLNEGDEVEILEQVDGWYKVKAKTELGKITGYISKELVDVEEKTNQETEVEEKTDQNVDVVEKVEETTTAQSNVEIKENSEYTLLHEIKIKILPLIYSKEKTQITGNIKIVEIINDWARVESDTGSGWIRNNVLKGALTRKEEVVSEGPKTELEPQPEQETETKPEIKEEVKEPEITEMNKVGYVKTDGLRVRTGPSTDNEEITSLSKNAEVKITGKTGNWYRIKLNGKIGYVSAKYISDTKVHETTSRSGNTLKEETPGVPETTQPAQSTSGTTGAAVVEYAKQYLGCKYVSGGTSPSGGFDCSGFTQYVYKNFGITINRISRDQFKNGVAVEKSDLQPGDLVMFNNGGNTAIGHVGIYIGDGNFIHASNKKSGVKISPLTSSYYQARYVGARRVI